MKLRQEEDKGAGPVDKRDLNPGDYVERRRCAYFVTGGGRAQVKAFAVSLSHCGDSDEMDVGAGSPIYRIEITGTENGKLTWKRIGTEPKRVTQDDLVAGDWVSCDGALCVVYGGEATRYGHPICAFSADGHRALWQHDNCIIIYRAEICGFEPGENGEDGTLLWRRK